MTKYGIHSNRWKIFPDTVSFISGDGLAFLDPMEQYFHNAKGRSTSTQKYNLLDYPSGASHQLIPFCKEIFNLDRSILDTGR